MNNYYYKLVNNLDNLGLNEIKNSLESITNQVNSGEIDFTKALYELTEREIILKQKRAETAMVKVANFPFIKTFNDYDFSFQPLLNKNEVLDLKYLKFIENHENIIFMGPPGVGKTHLATSLGIEAAINRISTYFISCHDLVSQLKKLIPQAQQNSMLG